jgi:hypothetical protein
MMNKQRFYRFLAIVPMRNVKPYLSKMRVANLLCLCWKSKKYRKLAKSILAVVLMLPLLTQAEIYKWVDKDGHIHFGDKAQDAAEKVALQPLQSYSAPKVAEADSAQEDTASQQQERVNYQLQIISPSNKATFHNNLGNVDVSLSLVPELQADDKIRLMLDGKSMSEGSQLTMQLSDIERGEHKLQAQIINSTNDVLAASDGITIYMHRAAIPLQKKKI